MAINLQLEKLYYEEKEETLKAIEVGEENKQEYTSLSQNRVAQAKKLIPEVDFTEIWNCHYMAYLLQHGSTTADYKLAHHYAKKAVDMGSRVTKWLYAATLDRYLVSQNKPQKFGTQFTNINGEWQLFPVDQSISDDERIEHGVAPLSLAVETFKNKYSRKKNNGKKHK